MSSERPEEPHYRNTPTVLSPASPKPTYFPAPTNITVLEMQHDVGFNQTEAHMSDPAAHNTDIRENMWRDPNEQAHHVEHEPQEEDHGQAAKTTPPYSAGTQDSAMGMETFGGSGDDMTEPQTDNAIAVVTDEPAPPNTSPPAESQPAVPTTSADTAHALDSGADGAVQTSTTQDPSSAPNIPTPADTSATVAHDEMSHGESEIHSTASAFNPNTVDVQALLDSLQSTSSGATAATNAPQAASIVATTDSPDVANQPHHPSYMSSPVSTTGLSAAPSGLPPRPPPQEQPLIHPNYVHSQHIRDYHPHAAHPAFQPHVRTGSQGNVADPNSKTYVPPVHSPATADAGVGSPQHGPLSNPLSNGQPSQQNQPHPQYANTAASGGFMVDMAPPDVANPQAPGNGDATSIDHRMVASPREGRHHPSDERPFSSEVQEKYDRFLDEERRYVNEGRWEQFPVDSRLFVGNLSSEQVTKRDIFHVFHTYGELAQISIKQAYGFVQFLRTEDCMRAMATEQGTVIRGKKIHTEVSRPQKNRQQARRSRSPLGGSRRVNSNVDRYEPSDSRSNFSRNNNNRRDGYNQPSYRSPSPRGYRDRRDDRYHGRSHSPDYGRGGGRRRSPSPRDRVDDGLPLPKRQPQDVPDVQVIVLEHVDLDFIRYVESGFLSRHVRADVLLLSPRLNEDAVVRRQMLEGVTAVVKLNRTNQNTGKIDVTLFLRNNTDKVGTETYLNLEVNVVVELVLRAKNEAAAARAQPQHPSYGGAYGGQQQSYAGGYNAPQQPAYAQHAPSSYNFDYGHQAPPQSASGNPNLQNLLANFSTPNSVHPTYGAGATAGTPASAYHPSQQDPAQATYMQHQQHSQQGGAQGGQQVDMQAILARLGGGNFQR